MNPYFFCACIRIAWFFVGKQDEPRRPVNGASQNDFQKSITNVTFHLIFLEFEMASISRHYSIVCGNICVMFRNKPMLCFVSRVSIKAAALLDG
jgi:hypothetical protein